jgi:hypothetical protein
VGAIAALVAAVVAIVAYLVPPQTISSVTNPPALTATIESFPYRHAKTRFPEREEELKEAWLESLEYKLKRREVAPELLEIVIEEMREIIAQKSRSEFSLRLWGIDGAQKWYHVSIRNDGDLPLKGVFLKYSKFQFWIDERGRLAPVPEKIEIGDMDQKSDVSFTFWGDRMVPGLADKEPVLGHLNGIGTIEFE